MVVIVLLHLLTGVSYITSDQFFVIFLLQPIALMAKSNLKTAPIITANSAELQGRANH